jgi:hypothetical protein
MDRLSRVSQPGMQIASMVWVRGAPATSKKSPLLSLEFFRLLPVSTLAAWILIVKTPVVSSGDENVNVALQSSNFPAIVIEEIKQYYGPLTAAFSYSHSSTHKQAFFLPISVFLEGARFIMINHRRRHFALERRP